MTPSYKIIRSLVLWTGLLAIVYVLTYNWDEKYGTLDGVATSRFGRLIVPEEWTHGR